MAHSNIDERFVLREDSLDDLYSWIDLIPLSRPKKHISRDFSDSILCAEVIAHFAPKLVEMHNYIPANSTVQKKINWTTLNRKVLSKLGLKFTESTIQQLAEARPGAIEQVLFDIRKKLLEYKQNEEKAGRKSVTISTSPSVHSTNVSYIRGFSDGPVEYTLDNVPIQSDSARISSVTSNGSGGTQNKTSVQAMTNNMPASGYQAQASISSIYHPPDLPPPQMLMDPSHVSLTGLGVDGFLNKSPSNNNNNNDPARDPPSQIIYKGHKMVPQATLEVKDREIKALKIQVKNLETKVHRVDTLVNVKDQRIEDLTRQLHGLRAAYERITQQNWTGFV